MDNNIIVTIHCIAYNQEKYIRECLDGFVMQKTTFQFEALVHDDASTDKTPEIIREYAKKYPSIIKPFFQEENQYTKDFSVVTQLLIQHTKGKYIATCEGDDYWIDPYKLQKQVDFLEANADFAICFHPVKIRMEEEDKIVDDFITQEVPDVTDVYRLAEGNYIHTPSVLFKNNPKVFIEIKKMEMVYFGDYVLHMLNAQYGKIKKMTDRKSVV